MELLIIILFRNKRMKKNGKTILLYIVRIIELIITGAAGGVIGGTI